MSVFIARLHALVVLGVFAAFALYSPAPQPTAAVHKACCCQCGDDCYCEFGACRCGTAK